MTPFLKYVLPVALIILTMSKDVTSNAFLKQKDHPEVLKLMNCTTSVPYDDLDSFDFLPRNVPLNDTTCLTLRMFRDLGFVEHFNISLDALSRFIIYNKNMYRKHPYHNWSHGFGVLQFAYAVLKNAHVLEENHLTMLEGMALLTAAMGHDLDHSGTDNNFLEKTNDTAFTTYGHLGSPQEDKFSFSEFLVKFFNSVDWAITEKFVKCNLLSCCELQRHQIDTLISMLENPYSNFVNILEMKDLIAFKAYIKKMLVETDLRVHLKLTGEEKRMADTGFDKDDEKHREMLRGIIISCGDLSDSAKNWNYSRAVAKKMFKEFFEQGSWEKQLGYIPEPSIDPKVANIPRIQIHFLNITVIPNFVMLNALYPETKVCLDNVKRNLDYWQKSLNYINDQVSKMRDKLEILDDPELGNPTGESMITRFYAA